MAKSSFATQSKYICSPPIAYRFKAAKSLSVVADELRRELMVAKHVLDSQPQHVKETLELKAQLEQEKKLAEQLAIKLGKLVLNVCVTCQRIARNTR